MAEDLGRAVLRLDIDDSLFRQKLADARRLIENTSVRGGRGGRSASGGGTSSQDRRAATMTITRSLGERLNRLEERGIQVDRARGFLSRAALATDRRRIETARTLNRLAREFIVEQERGLKGRGGAGRMAADPINALEKAQDRRFALNRRITSLEERGVDVSRLRVALGRLTEAQSAREFENQRRQSVQLSRQVRLEEDRFKRVQSRQRLERQQGLQLGQLNRSPVTGRTPTGAIPGSPAALQDAVSEGIRRGLLNSSPVTGRTPTGPIPGSPAARAAEERATRQRQQRDAAEQRRLETERRRAQAEERRRQKAIADEQKRQLDEGLRLGRLNASPVTGQTPTGAIPGSPAARRQAQAAERRIQQERERAARQEENQLRQSQSRRSQAINSGLIGGAFPLLFGQGAGASVGGLAGGLLGGLGGGGGGFAGSLVGTAIGAQVDAAVQRLNTLGSALNDPIGKFQELAQAGLISSSALQKNVQALIASGREAEAAAQLQLDSSRQFGDTSSLSELSSATDEMNRSFARLSVVLSKFIAGPLADFFTKLAQSNNLISGQAVFNERAAQLGLNEQQRSGIIRQARANTADDPASFYEEALAIADELYGKSRQTLAAEQKLSSAVQRTNDLRSNSFRLIDAEAFGNKELALDLQKRRIELERINRLEALGRRPAAAAVEQINTEAARETYKITQEQARLQRQNNAERVAALSRIASFEDQIAISQQSGRLLGPGRQALQSIAQFRDAVRAEREAQAALAVDPGNQSLISAAQVAGKAVEAAAARARADLQDAFRSAVDAARQISRSAEDLRLNFLQNRTGGQGVTRFLRGQARVDNERQTFSALLPLFQQARSRLSNSFAREGNVRAADQIGNLNFSGSAASVNQRMIDFINAARSDTRIQEDIIRTNEDLVRANNDLAVITRALADSNVRLAETMPSLASSMETLASKDWSVQVTVAADGSSSAYGDVVNGVLSQ